jgi:serine/threonine-protein kinase
MSSGTDRGDRGDIDPMLGRVLDSRFTIRSRLGAGSMGTVYRAKQHAMGRDVAIKILRSDRALDDAARARFLREARANSLLASPHTVTVFDFGQADNGDFFLAMELLEGESLGQRITRLKRLSVEMAVDTARQALRSLSEAHAKGIIHRDLKPDNLFYARVQSGGHDEEIVKVLDFGIAKMLHAEGEAMNAVETQAGTVFGTPRYMSPEQAQGKPLDARSDLYSLGVIMYHMLTGRPPFTDDDAIVVMARHIKTPPRSPSEACPQAHIPPEVESVLLRVLAKDPASRPLNAEMMAQELTRALNLSMTATSGVRISLSGVTIPPPSASAPGSMPAPLHLPPPPVVPSSSLGAGGLAGTTNNETLSAPLSAPQLPRITGPTALDSLELRAAAGIPSKRRRAVVGGLVITALLAGAVVLGARAGSTSAPPSTQANASRPAANGPSIPPPPPPASASPSPRPIGAPTVSPPTTTFAELPRATSRPPSSPSPSPRPARPAATPKPTATTAPASSKGNYGLFE